MTEEESKYNKDVKLQISFESEKIVKSGIKPPHPKGWDRCSSHYTIHIYNTSHFLKLML